MIQNLFQFSSLFGSWNICGHAHMRAGCLRNSLVGKNPITRNKQTKKQYKANIWKVIWRISDCLNVLWNALLMLCVWSSRMTARAAVLFFTFIFQHGPELLIIKPNYENIWESLPSMIDANFNIEIWWKCLQGSLPQLASPAGHSFRVLAITHVHSIWTSSYYLSYDCLLKNITTYITVKLQELSDSIHHKTNDDWFSSITICLQSHLFIILNSCIIGLSFRPAVPNPFPTGIGLE